MNDHFRVNVLYFQIESFNGSVIAYQSFSFVIGSQVRYESRKKLAEQRPRVKGQFVRHVPSESSPGNS